MIATTIDKLKIYGVRHFRKLAFDVGVIRGHSDYERFIILSSGRTGSNLLRSLLNSHSQIITFGELFRRPSEIGWDYPGYKNKAEDISLIHTNPSEFLETKLWKKFPKHISAVGFKIFYTHAQEENWRSVWHHLRDQKELKVIHLKRKNILKTYISLKKAQKTGRWRNANNAQEEKVLLTLDYNDCLNRFTRTRAFEEQFDKFFEDHQVFQVLYEDLARDSQREMEHILQFLRIQHEAVRPLIYKQSNQPPSEIISNYSELKEQFKNTPWQEFFED